MKIAILGTRGVPARYGGFETFAEEVGKRMVAKGHEVCVYCRSGYYPKKQEEYLGMRLVYIPEIKWKFFETIFHTFLSLLHAVKKRFDIIFICNVANSILLPVPLVFGRKTVMHVDGLDWKRQKWNLFGKKYYEFSEWVACLFPGVLIADSHGIEKYYQRRYGRKLHYVSYGANITISRDASILDSFKLKPGEYFLQITRFEPENNPLLSVKAFSNVSTDKKLVMVGGAKYGYGYSARIFSVHDKRILRLGFIYDKNTIRELQANAYAYIHGNEVGGTNPGLLQAMAAGCFVISRDVAFNREVLCDAGIYYKRDEQDLKKKLTWVLEHPEEKKELGQKGQEIIKKYHSWDSVVSGYEKLFYSLL